MRIRPATLVALALLAIPLAGCLDLPTGADLGGAGSAAFAYDTSRGWSMPLSPALHAMLPGVKAFVEARDAVPLAIGIFLPEMAGCDWEADALPEACRLPVVMDAGPYYGDRVAIDKYRPPTIEWLVPRGYAVIQMSLRGTGESGGCMEFKSPRDVEDVSDVIDWIAARPWSNGNVGMIGRSYDGTGAWSGAASGNPHLKTIVPISGAVDGPGLYYKNGTSEERGWNQHVASYWMGYALGLEDRSDPLSRVPQWPENACRGVAESVVEGPAAAATGDGTSPYWVARDLRPAILEKYGGSAWVIHGLHDWNVNPSQAVPFVQTMQDAGIPVRAWLGVWGHAYPDRVDEHRNVRWDWADETVRWFDHYLKGVGATPRLGVEVEDSLFVWRHEATYPPRDAVWTPFELGAGGALAPEGEADAGAARVSAAETAAFRSAPLERALRIAGLPRLHVTVTPTTPAGGYLFAELHDVYPDGRSVRIGWAAIDLRHHAGGNGAPATLTPGQSVVAMMEFEPVDALVAEGHTLRLVLHKAGVEDVMPSPSPEVNLVTLGGGASLLKLPLVERPTIVPSYRAPGL